MPAPADDWITAPHAARLLGVRPRTVYDLIDRGEMRAEVTVPPGRQQRSIRLRRQDVDDFLAEARLQPGELRHLFPVDGCYRGRG